MFANCRHLAPLAIALLLLCVLPHAAHSEKYFVAQDHPRAADDNPGTAEHPWKTIGKAAATLRPGDTVVIQSGIYRERVKPANSGTEDERITYRVAPGEQVVISGADRLTGWQPCPSDESPYAKNILYVDIDWSPPALYADNRKLPMAREPDEGWWVAEGGGEETLVDRENLSGDTSRFVNAQIFWWDVNITSQSVRTVKNAEDGNLTLDEPWGYGRTIEAGKDRYYVRGKLAFLDRPGEWAAEAHGDGYRLYLWPPKGKDPEDMLVEASNRSRFLVEYGNHKHLVFDGFEVRHGASHGIGSWSRTSRDINILNCHVHHNLGNGLYLRYTEHTTARDNRVLHNKSGVSCGTSNNLKIVGNEIGHNNYDGLIVSHDSSDVLIRRNFIHDHHRWGHPDNVQYYRGVRNVRLEQNVLLNGGQAVMMEDVKDSSLTDNLIVGTGAFAVILGHNTVDNFTVDHNTIAMSGWGCISSTKGSHTVTNNILCPGPGTALAGSADRLKSDHNLFWKPEEFGGNVFAMGGIWTRSLAEHRQHNDLDEHSIRANPKFRNAPAAWAMSSSKRLTDCTRARIYLRSDAGVFKPGDRVELDLDGQRRRVTKVGKDFIEIDPALDTLLEKAVTIINWRDSEDFALDYRLSPDSPARGAAADGSDLGTTLSLPDLRDPDAVLEQLRSGADQ